MMLNASAVIKDWPGGAHTASAVLITKCGAVDEVTPVPPDGIAT